MIKLQEFYLKRLEDETGVSGEGVVAVGTIFPSGACVVEWLTFTSSITIFKNIEHVKEVHGHGGKTEVVMGHPDEKEEITKATNSNATKAQSKRKVKKKNDKTTKA